MKTKLSVAVASALALVALNQGLAFKPSNSFFTGSVPDYDPFGVPQNHRGMTGKALEDGISKNGVDYKFSDEVIEKIKKANSDVDAGTGFIKSVPHCDAEELKECSTQVQNLMKKIVNELSKNSPDYDSARTYTGQALHTIQDFYAHSNYAYLYQQLIKTSIATIETGFSDTDIEGSKAVDKVGNETCEWDLTGFDHIPTNNLGTRGKTKITTGYFQITDPIKFKCIHGGKGTGINKDHPLNTRFNIARDLAVSATKHFMEEIFTKVLASGISEPEKALTKYAGQNEVQIGFIIDTTGSMGDTITGVKSAISKVVTDIKNDPEKNISEFLVMVYGDPNLGSIKIAQDPDTMLSNINTVTLGVPDGGGDCPELATDGLRKAVQAASKGSELFLYTDADTKNAGISNTIITEAKAKKIVINFFVSGSCSGSSIDTTYTNIAKETGGSVYRYEHTVSGADGTFALINPKFSGNFQDSDKISSSLPASSLARSSDSKVQSQTIQIAPKLKLYHSSQGNLAYHIVPDEEKALNNRLLAKAVGDTEVEHVISVDSTVTNLVVSVDMSPLGEIKLYRPDGSEVLATDDGVTLNTTSVSETLSVDSPQTGEWRLGISGTPETKYELSIKMNSNIRLISFSFAEEKGRGGHTGLFPIDGQPLAKEDQFVVAILGGSVDTADLVITSLDGNTLNSVSLTERGSDGTAKKFVGKITLPTEDFRVHIKGKDQNGNDYKRLYPNVYHGQMVSIRPSASEHDLAAGSKFTANFEINNLGVADIFDITASNSLDYPITLSETELTLNQLDKKVIKVSIDIPSDAQADSSLDIVLNAASQTNADSRNTAISSFTINADTDGDGVSDLEEKGKVGSDDNYDGNNDGIPDYQQAKVASMYASTGLAYMTFEILDNGVLTSMKSVPDPSLGENIIENIEFPFGYIDFSIGGITNGESTRLKIHYPASINPQKYYKYGPTSVSPTSHWYEFSDVKFESGSVTITLKDGVDGDDDLTENGIIRDAAGIGVLTNKSPAAIADSVSTKEDTAITIDVLTNDGDPDGDTIVIQTADTTSTQGGTIVNNGDGTLTYTPKGSFIGSDAFEYTITDGKGGTDTAQVSITVSKKQSSGGGSIAPFGLILLALAGLIRRFYKK